jgi:uncharacterized protein (UPF0305 family)
MPTSRLSIKWVHNRSKNANTRQHYFTFIKSWIQFRKGYEQAFKAYSEAHKAIENPYLDNVGSNNGLQLIKRLKKLYQIWILEEPWWLVYTHFFRLDV